MEMLSMGPRRRDDDALLQIADHTDAEPVDLGVRSRSGTHEGEATDLGQRTPDSDVPNVPPAEHWLSGLVRTEVLGVSGAALLLLIAIGMPFLTAFETIRVYLAPTEINPAWTFVPTLVAASLAAALGFGGLRQAAYHGAATWARITSGVAATVGLLVAIGAAMVWFAMAQANPFEQLGP